MRKIWYRRILIILVLLATILGTNLGIEELQDEEKRQEVSTRGVDSTLLIPGGMPIGIYMETDGVLVLDTDSIEGMDGTEYAPAKNLVKSGDYIVGINGEEVNSKNDLIQAVGRLDSREVVLSIRREEEYIDVKMNSVEVDTNEYKLGIWVRDSVQGLGTITYLTSSGEFGALGHGIHDTDTEELLEIENGTVYVTNIIGIQKGEKGTPGGLEGIIIYNRHNILGTIEDNTECGIYGTIKNVDALFEEQEAMEICEKREIELGAAVIRCAVDGEVKEYDIKIKNVDYFTRDENKGIIIEIVDEELLELTGGIVQGMSGSPILQHGKIVGAVTHVLVNDPTRGYGIFIEDMMNADG
ncbi:MAG: SpoIVB peptidase [Tyzzerella sp.]|nr:SpoIVB peptidase [Tyzzerella sp.]